jgi:putative hemolysin
VMRPRGSYSAFRPPIRAADLGGKTPPGDYVAILRPGSDDVDAAIALSGFSLISADRLDEAAAEVVHVPWCATLATVLTLLREQVADVASVVNEFGETIGIVTYDDILDTVLIPEPDRSVRFLAREPVLEVAPGCYHVEGITPLRHLCSRLGMEYEPESDELVTLAGLLHEKLEHMPQVGDECSWRGYQIRVIEVLKRGRLRAVVSKEEPATEAAQ